VTGYADAVEPRMAASKTSGASILAHNCGGSGIEERLDKIGRWVHGEADQSSSDSSFLASRSPASSFIQYGDVTRA